MDAKRFWDEFHFDYRLEQKRIYESLITIEAHRQTAQNLILAPEWRRQLDRLNRVRAVHGTTALEGNPLSEAEASYQIDVVDQESDMPVERVTREQQQIRNAANAQDWVKDRFTADQPPVRLNDILTMHTMITKGSDENNNIPGRLRSQSVTVGSPHMGGVHVGAPHDTLTDLMEEFVRFVNSNQFRSEHPVVRALLAHFFLVTIHPFGDGNGRVSRLLEAGFLFQNGFNVHGFYGLSNFFYSSGDQYKTLLQKTRRTQPFDVTSFVTFGIKGFVEELEGINNFIKTKINRVMYRQTLVAALGEKVSERRRMLNNREYQLLTYLLRETEPRDPFSEQPSRRIELDELVNSSYVSGAYRNVTRRTFMRELFRLREMEFIKVDTSEPNRFIIEIDFEAIAKHQMY